MMKRLIAILLILVLISGPTIALAASSIAGARYWAVIQISNNSTAETFVATTANISTTNLINGNYLNSSANNCVMRTSSGADVPFMPGYTTDNYPWCIWVPSIGDYGYQSDILYTANSSGGEIRYFPDTGGMTTLDNDATLELGDNFTVEQSGWVTTTFTDNYSDRNLVYKKDAFRTYVSGAENITSSITTSFLDFTEEDDNNKLEVTTSKATGEDVDSDEDVYLYRDMGVGYFDAIDIDFEIYISNLTLASGRAGVAFANIVGDAGDFAASAIHAFAYRSGANYQIYLMRGTDVAFEIYAGSSNTLYYCTVERAVGSDTVHLFIYSDAARTVELDDLVVAGFGATKYRYIYGFVNNNIDTGGRDWDGYIQNLELGKSVTATGVSTGNHTVMTMLVSDNLSIWIDGELQDSIFSIGVTNNSEDWTFIENDVMPYMEYQKIWIDGVLRQHIVWEYDDEFTDLSGNSNPATPSFRSASSDADVSAELISFQPVSEAKAPDYVLGEAPAFIDPAITGNVTGTFTTTPGTGTFPLAGVITAIAEATETPPQLPLLIIAVFVILAASLSVSATMRRYGSGSILVKVLVISAVMGIFIALGNFAIDFWMLVVFLIIGISIAFMSKQLGWS